VFLENSKQRSDGAGSKLDVVVEKQNHWLIEVVQDSIERGKSPVRLVGNTDSGPVLGNVLARAIRRVVIDDCHSTKYRRCSDCFED
jgi:hypothetical protein